VAVKQTLTQAGKTVEKAIGEKPWTVKVVAPPADPKKPGEKPPADAKKPGGKAPGDKPPAEKPPAGTGSTQEEQAPQELITSAYGAGRAAAAVIRRDSKDMYGKYRMPTPRYARDPVLTAAFYRGYDDEWTSKPNVPPKQNDLRSPIKPLTTNTYTAGNTATGDEAVQSWIKTAYVDGNFLGEW